MNFTLKTFFKVLAVSMFFIICMFSCKKNDIKQEFESNKQIEDFLRLDKNAPQELTIIVNNLREQLYKRNFVSEFLQWHGNPQWNKAIKLKKTNPGWVTLAIPTFKEGILTTFFAATITPNGKILFEMHRVSSFTNSLKEYTYIGIDSSISRFYLSLFSSGKKEHVTKKSAGDNLVEQCEYCWWYWGVCFEGFNSNTPSENTTGGGGIKYCWNELCQIEDCQTPGGGGSGGGGGDCPICPPPPECEDPLWYNIVPVEDPCNPPPPPPQNPADTILNPCIDIAFLQNSLSFISYLQELNDSTNSNREFAYLMFKDASTGIFGNTPIGLITGPENQLSLGDFENLYFLDCIAHSHFNTNTDTTKGLSIFSPDDLWSICEVFNVGNVNNPSSFSFALVTKSGTRYLLKIENLTKFRRWAQKFTEGSLDKYNKLYGDLYKIKNTNTIKENELQFLKFLKTDGGSGLKLFSGNTDFTVWDAKVLNNNNQVISQPCVAE